MHIQLCICINYPFIKPKCPSANKIRQNYAYRCDIGYYNGYYEFDKLETIHMHLRTDIKQAQARDTGASLCLICE